MLGVHWGRGEPEMVGDTDGVNVRVTVTVLDTLEVVVAVTLKLALTLAVADAELEPSARMGTCCNTLSVTFGEPASTPLSATTLAPGV